MAQIISFRHEDGRKIGAALTAPFQDDPRSIQEKPMSMNFGDAIAAMKQHKRVTRAGWNGRGMWLEMQFPDAHSKMTLPYIYMKTVDGHLVPWLASQTDMLSEDWLLA